MIPLITALFNQQVGGSPPVVPVTDIPTTLLLEDNTNSSNRTYTLSPGTAYASRVFVVAFFIYRNSATGAPTYTVTLDGVAMRYEALQTTVRGILNYAVIYDPTSTADRSINITVTNGSVSSLRIIRLGSPTTHVKSRQYFQQGGYGTAGYSSAVTMDPNTKLLLFAGRGNADALGLISESGSSLLGTEENASVEGDGRYVRNAILTLQPTGSLTTVSQDASASNTHKGQMGSVLSVKASDELTLLPRTDVLYYHMMAHKEAFKDASSTPCADGDTVQVWGNSGTSVDMQQATAARRPTYRTGGANGYPYLQCDRTTQQYFEDLTDIPQNGGSTTASPYTLAGVLELTDLAAIQPLLGDTNTRGKFFITTAGAISLYKPAFVYLTGAFTSGALVAFCANISEWQNVAGTVNNVEGSQKQVDAASGTVTNNVQVLRSTNGAAFFHGKLYELMYWRVALGLNDRQRVVLSLMEKYGLPFTP